MRLLHIDSSILGEGSASRTLTREIVARWKAARPDVEVAYLDLAAQELPHLTGRAFRGEDELEAARNRAILDAFLAADVVVIGAPMYNFTIPSQLKAWIDRVSIKGKTFRYTEKGPVGLAGGKRVIVAISRGGIYAANAAVEHGESYLRALFRFLGIEDLTFVRAEGLAVVGRREAALGEALAAIPEPRPRAA